MMRSKSLTAVSLLLTLALIFSACSGVSISEEIGATGEENKTPAHGTPGGSEATDPAPAEAGSGDGGYDCPTNYFWGGLTARSDDGYTYFVQYDQSSYEEQTINICRIADGDGKGEVIFSEPATWTGITSDDFDGRFVWYYALTAYKDRVYFLRSAEDTELWWISADGNESGSVTGWDGQAQIALNSVPSLSKISRDGKNLFFPWGVKIDMEKGISLPVFDPETMDLEDGGTPVILGTDGGFIYFYYSYEGDDFSGLYRILCEGGTPEAVPAITREYIKANDLYPSFMLTCVWNGTLWVTYPDSDSSFLEAIDLESGDITVISDAVTVSGYFSISRDGIYWFKDDGALWKCGLDGSGAEELTSLDSGKVFVKSAPMVSGDWIFYIDGEDDYGLFRVKKGAAYFPFENAMGDDVENGTFWGNGPVW